MYNFFITRQWTSGTVTVPTAEGLEYTLQGNKAHYTLEDNLTQFTIEPNRVHYDFEDEDL